MIKSRENSIGAKAFIAGVVLAVIIGLFTSFIPLFTLTQYGSLIYLVLVILGVIVGTSIHTNNKDSETFLITGAVIVLVSKFGMESVISSLIGIGGAGDIASSTFAALLALFVPATIVVAMKTVFGLSKV